MPRFFVPPEQIKDRHFVILGSEARHAAVVLRKQPGDTIDLFDGKDLSYHGRIQFVSPERVQGIILTEEKTSTLGIELVLYQGLIKGSKWDWLVEKACEVGVTRLVPLLTIRTVVKPKKGVVDERSQRIALAASKQSGRSHVMDVAAPQTLPEALASMPKGLALIPWEKESAKTIRQAMASQKHPMINLFIGPEGGWEMDEVERAIRAGAIPVSLGPTLLRSETAGLVASALVLSEYGAYS